MSKAWVLLQHPNSKAKEWAEGWCIHYTGRPLMHYDKESKFYPTVKKAWAGAARELLDEQRKNNG